MKKIILIFLIALACSPAGAQQVYDDVPKGKVYVYKDVDDVNREMEIYFPKEHDSSKNRVPGIILFHGGGWGGGNRKAFSYQCNYFASRGMVAATVTYRLRTKADRAAMKDGQSSKRVCIPDVKSAIRWFKQHAEELGVDSNRIVAGGGSAGGHISLVGTTNPGLNDPNDPKGIDTSVAAYILFNPALSPNDSKDPDVDFLRHLNADFGPAIVFFGSHDKWLKNGWTPAVKKMKTLGITSVELQIAEGQTHAFFNKQPWKDITLIAADQFLNKLGYLRGEPTLSMPKSGETLKKQPQPNVPAPAQSKNQPKPAVSAETLALYEPGEFKGVQYRFMKPIDFDPSRTYPLVLSLHGGAGRGTRNIKNLLIWNEYLADEDLRRKHPAFVLAPQSNGRWLDNTSEVKLYPESGSITIDDLPESMRKFGPRLIESIEEANRSTQPTFGVLDEVLELIDTRLSKQFKIDADRVYVLGHSMGGMGTFTAIYQHPDRFAAAIPSAGFFPPWLDAKRIQNVPLWIFHGNPDKVVDYMGSRHVFDQLNKLNGNAKLTTLPGVGHGSTNSPAFRYKGDDPKKGYITEYASDRCDKTDRVWDWLFRQSRSK